jgi:hypothetical protein
MTRMSFRLRITGLLLGLLGWVAFALVAFGPEILLVIPAMALLAACFPVYFGLKEPPPRER